MIIPEKVIIGAIEITIKKCQFEKKELLGKSDEKESVIFLNQDIPKTMQEKIFFHELLHIICDIFSYNEESGNEQFIDVMAVSLHQIVSQLYKN
jgi:Zn-dependent peptidase ImmA (M78 family)